MGVNLAAVHPNNAPASRKPETKSTPRLPSGKERIKQVLTFNVAQSGAVIAEKFGVEEWRALPGVSQRSDRHLR